MAYDRTCWYSLILMPVGHAFSCFPAIVIDDLHWFVWCCHCPSNEEKQIVWSHQVKLVCIKHAGSWLSTTLAAFTICLYKERYWKQPTCPLQRKKHFEALASTALTYHRFLPKLQHTGLLGFEAWREIGDKLMQLCHGFRGVLRLVKSFGMRSCRSLCDSCARVLETWQGGRQPKMPNSEAAGFIRMALLQWFSAVLRVINGRLNTETTPIWQVSKLEWSQCSTATYATSALGNRVCAEENCWTISRCWWWRHGHEAVNAVRNSRAVDESLQVKGETCWCQVVKIYSNLVHPRQIGNCFWMFLTSSLWALWAVFLRLDDTMSNILQVD